MIEQKLWLTVAVIALVTALIRFLPFIVFAVFCCKSRCTATENHSYTQQQTQSFS